MQAPINMSEDEQTGAVLAWLSEPRDCGQCGTRLRFGDYECPHCGADLEDDLRRWAEALIAALVVSSR